MCRVLGVSRSGFYAWQRRGQSARAEENRHLLACIKVIHKKRRRTYGSPRMHQELRREGFRCGRHRVARLMRQEGIRAKQFRRFRPTTNSNHTLPVAPNVLDRQFTTAAVNRKWVADITYVPTLEGWLYLGAVLDLASRRVVGHAMQERMTSSLVTRALSIALVRRRPDKGLLVHSDRGRQYASYEYQRLLARHGIRCSMSRRGDCYDNAAMESFFSTLKKELLHHDQYRTRKQAKRAIFEYIECFYNNERLHSALGYVSPADYERSLSA